MKPEDRVSKGGGHEDEGEDIETLEVTIEEALAMVPMAGSSMARRLC